MNIFYFQIYDSFLSREPPTVSQELKDLISEVMSEVVGLSEAQKHKIKFESNYSTKFSSFGSLSLSPQVFSLLPYHLNIFKNNDISLDKLNNILQNEYFTSFNDQVWSTLDGLKVLDTLRLSKQAKKFLILREIYSFDTKWLFYNTLAVTISFHLFLKAQSRFFAKLKFVKGVLFRKILLTSGFIFLAMLFCSFLQLGIEFKRYSVANSKAITKGQHTDSELRKNLRNGYKFNIDDDYYDGAIEAFTKEIKRNKLVKNILSSDADLRTNILAYRISDKGEIKAAIKPLLPAVVQLDQLILWKN